MQKSKNHAQMKNVNQIINKIATFNVVKEDIKNYELQEKVLKKLSYFYMFIVSGIFFFTIVGPWMAKNKAIELKRKSDSAHKAKINLLQANAFMEQELNAILNKSKSLYKSKELVVNKVVTRVKLKPKERPEWEHVITYAFDKYQNDLRTKKLKQFEDILFFETVNNLFEENWI